MVWEGVDGEGQMSDTSSMSADLFEEDADMDEKAQKLLAFMRKHMQSAGMEMASDNYTDHSDARYSSMKRGMAKMKELMAGMLALMDKDMMEDLPDHKRETAAIEKGEASETSSFIHSTSDQTTMQGAHIMTTSNSTIATAVPAAPQPETFAVKKEEFEALRAEAEKAKTELAAVRQQADTFAAQLRETQRARRRDQLVEHCREFVAVPIQAVELAEKFQALEEKDSELFAYFDGLIGTLDKALTQAELFGQKATSRAGAQAETYEALAAKLLADKFDGDTNKWSEAYDLARKQRPDLFNLYNETAYATGGKE